MFQWLLQVGYNVLFVMLFAVTWPYFTWRLRKRGMLWRDFGARLGIYSQPVRQKLRHGCDLWIHAVSVGEVMIASVLIYHLRQSRALMRIVLTTTTATGYRMAQGLASDYTVVLYNPTDFYWGVLSAFRHFKPKMLVLVEAEIWPNYLWTARRRKIPVYLINARLSQRTEQRYRSMRWFVRPVLKHLNLVFAQHHSDVPRLIGAGFPAEAVFTVGSLKYDVADLPESQTRDVESWWSKLGWQENRVVLMGGSTHSGEEEVLARLFLKLRADFPQLRLMLVPRHAERGAGVGTMCREELGLKVALRTEIAAASSLEEPEVVVVNSTGELRALYRYAQIVFIGKSLRARGGQNFIEAARVGVPILVGPNMQNFEQLLAEFIEKQGIIQVRDQFELLQRVRELLLEPSARERLGSRAQATFAENLGAGKRTAGIIVQRLIEQLDRSS